MTDINTLTPAPLLHNTTALTEALPELAARGYTLPDDATHQKIWKGVVNGRIPAVKINGRYRLDTKGMDAAAVYLGLTAPAVSAAKPRKAAPISVAA
jgi:hypothetical protein